MDKTLEDRLKEMILAQYGDMKSFSVQAGIPNSTLSSMFQRGILNSTINRVIQLSKALNISVDGLVEGNIKPMFYFDECNHTSKPIDLNGENMKELKAIYNSLNETGKKQLMTQARQIANFDEYKATPRQSKHA